MTPETLMTAILSELQHIRRDVADVRDEVTGVKVLQAHHNTSLELHMKRSDALEKLLDVQSGRIKPLEIHVSGWAGVGKAFSVVCAVGALAAAVAAVVKFLI